MGGDNRQGSAAEALGVAALWAGFLFGGMAFGLAVALVVGGGSEGALFVGFMALPLAFGLGMVAWRAIVGAWFVAKLTTSAVRSRGREDRFRAEVQATLDEIGKGGPAGLPGTWVFVPVAVIVGVVAALLMLIVADGSRVGAAALLFAGSVGVGLALRRLARAGRLPLPEE
jgi:hypothetical protein